MKPEMALILMNDGNPVMTLAKVGKLINIGERTAENQVYAQTFPIPVFKLGSKWFCHVTDVAAPGQRVHLPRQWRHLEQHLPPGVQDVEDS